MLRYELTPNNAGFVLWGDAGALDELHQLIHFTVDERPLIKVKDGLWLMIFVKPGRVAVWLISISTNIMIYINCMVNGLHPDK
ncbi:hypothetical protein ACE2AK_23930 [Rahnella perminowiae]